MKRGVQDVLDVSICETREQFPEEIDVLVNSTTNLHKLGFNENVHQEPEHLAELFDMGPWGEFGLVEWIHLDKEISNVKVRSYAKKITRLLS